MLRCSWKVASNWLLSWCTKACSATSATGQLASKDRDYRRRSWHDDMLVVDPWWIELNSPNEWGVGNRVWVHCKQNFVSVLLSAAALRLQGLFQQIQTAGRCLPHGSYLASPGVPNRMQVAGSFKEPASENTCLDSWRILILKYIKVISSLQEKKVVWKLEFVW